MKPAPPAKRNISKRRASPSRAATLALEFAARLMRHPAAPFFESGPQAEALKICAEHDLPAEFDPFGNLLVRCAQRPGTRPMVLAAHLDHPGFAVERRLGPKRFAALFNGGVPPEHFRPGTPVLLQPGDIPARLGKRLAAGEKRYELVSQRAPANRPEFAVWDLVPFVQRKGRVHGRACDDLIGCAVTLAVLAEARARRLAVNLIGVLSRAEEVGFHGALTIAADARLPKDALVVSLETSKELPAGRMGEGVIVRVGDKGSVFGLAGTRFLSEVAAEMAAQPGGFAFQRALMGGGTCEATAYQEYGYSTAAVCVALGNYHNCAPGNRIAAEFVSAADMGHMADLLLAAARAMPRFAALTGKIPRRLRHLLRQARRRLA